MACWLYYSLVYQQQKQLVFCTCGPCRCLAVCVVITIHTKDETGSTFGKVCTIIMQNNGNKWELLALTSSMWTAAISLIPYQEMFYKIFIFLLFLSKIKCMRELFTFIIFSTILVHGSFPHITSDINEIIGLHASLGIVEVTKGYRKITNT